MRTPRPHKWQSKAELEVKQGRFTVCRRSRPRCMAIARPHRDAASRGDPSSSSHENAALLKVSTNKKTTKRNDNFTFSINFSSHTFQKKDSRSSSSSGSFLGRKSNQSNLETRLKIIIWGMEIRVRGRGRRAKRRGLVDGVAPSNWERSTASTRSVGSGRRCRPARRRCRPEHGGRGMGGSTASTRGACAGRRRRPEHGGGATAASRV